MANLAIFGIATPYAEELIESAQRQKIDFDLIDNLQENQSRFPTAKRKIEDQSIEYIVAPASSAARAAAVENAINMGAKRFGNLIDPTSVIATTSKFGCGNYVNALVSIGAATQIGCHININRSSSIGHHCQIDDFVATGPGVVLSGSVSIGRGSFIGAGTTILPKVKIGKNVMIGAGSLVVSDIEDDVIAFGSPARVVKPNAQWIGLDRCLAH